ncbi:hypothetical protein B0T17DRAFT_339439 [Bombardia bombarda]|uniref:Secreted protein n=1 Tax=Bombardia bombarda TaxID=252184 RepID=A0AA39WN35_9PEZI|nr:hypothetical protein B0T17DRAFT_339439 [Bombardia bombarda]
MIALLGSLLICYPSPAQNTQQQHSHHTLCSLLIIACTPAARSGASGSNAHCAKSLPPSSHTVPPGPKPTSPGPGGKGQPIRSPLPNRESKAVYVIMHPGPAECMVCFQLTITLFARAYEVPKPVSYSKNAAPLERQGGREAESQMSFLGLGTHVG